MNRILVKHLMVLKLIVNILYKKASKGSKPFTLYFVSIVIGIIILNFVIILDNPPKK